MTDQEKKAATGKQPETRDLLSDFGARPSRPAAMPPAPKPTVAKQTPTSVDAQASVRKAEGASDASRSDKPSATKGSGQKKNTASASKASVKNQDTRSTAGNHKSDGDKNGNKQKKADKEAHASTAQKKKGNDKGEIDLDNQPRSSRPAHQVIPYVLYILALIIGLSLLLNLFCNFGNKLENTPTEHWMGKAGYYLCFALFSTLGPAIYLLPFALVYFGFFWKSFIDRKCLIFKLLAAVAFIVLFASIIHIFCLNHISVKYGIPVLEQNYSTDELMRYGAQMTSGGIVGGRIGYLLVSYLNTLGALILGFCLLALSGFFLLGLTPQHLWSRARVQRELRSERAPSPSQQDAEAAHNRAVMDEKIRRMTGRQLDIDDVDPQTGAPEGAVEIVTPAKSKADKLAPMPLPHLDPGDETNLFVPSDINQKMQEKEQATQPKETTPLPTPDSKPSEATVAEKKAESTQPLPAATVPNAEVKTEEPAPVLNPAKNKDTAVDPIFPKTEGRQLRRIPKEDRNFDLKKVFIDFDDEDEKPAPRKHAPVPPEVPPVTPMRPAATTVQKPTASPTQKTAQSGTIVAGAQRTVAPKAAEQKPIFRQADSGQEKEFGLSSEEFEKLEAGQPDLKKPTPKAAGDAKGAVKQPVKPVTPPKPEKPKKYVFPPVSYLHPGEPMTEENRAEIEANMTQLAETLASFHVRVQEINFSCGPTVTRYEVVLAAGVRVRTVVNLADDIALALRSSGGVRIEAPIPGTNAVGIEVPNKTRSTIYLRDLIESKRFTEASSKLSACLGADIAGDPLIFDIAKMPHLLIAGTTGSGKSVCINCIITSLLYKVRPDEVKLVLIDPKKVEFSIYKNIPHLMAPVVTTPKDAAGALQAAVEEMERRFEVFETVGVRDLKGYNTVTADDPDMPYIPHMVIIIDELADLMMTAKNEVETAICRIAQKARAAGIHLIIGTQRPSVDVVTGLIKANVPSSIAFAVKSQMDSRVILDHGGAEALLGRGDMLFVPIGAMRDTRVQGAFVDDKEVESICEFIRSTNGVAEYDEHFIAKLKELAAQCGNKGKASNDDLPVGADGEKGDDPKYADAVRVAIEEKRISTSLLQRKLEVGYSRAAKLIDRMQSEGIVSPPDGSKPRAILITPEEYLARFVDNVEATE